LSENVTSAIRPPSPSAQRIRRRGLKFGLLIGVRKQLIRMADVRQYCARVMVNQSADIAKNRQLALIPDSAALSCWLAVRNWISNLGERFGCSQMSAAWRTDWQQHDAELRVEGHYGPRRKR